MQNNIYPLLSKKHFHQKMIASNCNNCEANDCNGLHLDNPEMLRVYMERRGIKDGHQNLRPEHYRGDTLYHKIAIYDAVDCLKYLLSQNGPDINSRDEYDQTVFHYVVMFDAMKCLDVLIERGGIETMTKETKRDILRKALRYGPYEKRDPLEVLLEHQCFRDILNEQDKNGKTFLHYAISRLRDGSLDCLVYLIEHGGHESIHKLDNKGGSLLHHAAIFYSFNATYAMETEWMLSFAKTLIDYGVNPHIKDRDGHEFLDYVFEPKLKEELEEYISQISTMDIKEPSI